MINLSEFLSFYCLKLSIKQLKIINLLSGMVNLPFEMINIDKNEKFIVLCCFGV